MLSRDSLYPILSLLSCLVLTSCASINQQPANNNTTSALQQQEAQTAPPTQQLIQQAKQQHSPARERYLLQIATSLFYQGAQGQAAAILKEVNPEQLELGLLIRRQLLAARIAEREGSPSQVITALEPLNGIPLGEVKQARRYYQLLIDAYQLLEQYPQEADARIGIMPYIGESEARLDNIQRLLDIALIINDQLKIEHDPLVQESLQQRLGLLLGALESWRYSDNSSQERSLLEGTLAADNIIEMPQQIAVLLPLTGRYGQAANAVRDGILSVYYDEQSTSTLRFYDTQGEKEQAWTAYRQAIRDGANFVIGPLTKEAVNHLAMIDIPHAPILALNHSTTHKIEQNGFYQLTLSPEDEATQVALQAWNSGLRNPIILVPESNWGTRINLAFQEQWEQLGGTILSEQRYNAKENDYSKPIRAAFELNLSDQRHRDLQKALHTNIKFTPRRRQDVDFAFIAAQPRQARLLRPQFKFHYASDIPIYSTSHLYQGTPNPQQDRDMDGIIFGDTPWTLETSRRNPLREKILATWPSANKKYWRLYAMGIDAYRLSAFLQARPNSLSYYGETGLLKLTGEGALYRQLTWAKFYRGKPQKL